MERDNGCYPAPLRYLSVCSGIEAATVAWHPLGWQAIAYSEIEAFPAALLAHHYPDVPNLGDMTRLHESEAFRGAAVDLLVGGTPCQAFSVAGLRKGLADPRGNLALVFLGIADRARPRWVVWENVPGVLSSAGGRDFGAFLGGLGELGYGWAYRILDAQYFGVAQRRRRVFVVGHLGSWQRAAAVLFERDSLSGHPAPGRDAGAPVAGTLAGGSGRIGGKPEADGNGLLIPFDRAQLTSATNRSNPQPGDPCHTLHRHEPPAVAVGVTLHGSDGTATVASLTDTASALRARVPGMIENSTTTAVLDSASVRRLTPRECERLQGFPDDYTAIPYRGKPAADAPRYKALGNSMAVPVMAWIGRRIAKVEEIA